MEKRSEDEIVAEILQICKKGALKARIVFLANLNFRTVEPYLDLLVKNDLLKKTGEVGHSVYETTDKGVALLMIPGQVKVSLNLPE